MDKFLLYKDIRIHGETFETGEVIESNTYLDPSIAMLVTDYDGDYRKLSLIDGIYVYDDRKDIKDTVKEPVKAENQEPVKAPKAPVKHIQKSKKR